jgi:hypothetical protein
MLVRVQNTMRSGHYYIGVSVGSGPGGEELDALAPAADFVVASGDHIGGLVELPHRIELSHALESATR